MQETNTKRYYELPYFRQNWQEIKHNLSRLKEQQYQDFPTLSKIINAFHILNNYNTNHRDLCALEKYPFEEVKRIFSKIASFVLESESKYRDTPHKFQLFQRGEVKSQTFTKQDVILLMCFSALCLNKLNESIGENKKTYHNSVNFSFIYTNDADLNKVPWIINYFNIVLDEENLKSDIDQKMTIIRRSDKLLHAASILKIDTPLSHVKVISKGSIEDQLEEDVIKIDFANKFIGGGSLGEGCVQQEIMFLNHTELYITMFLCEVMGPDEAIGMRGFKKYFKNKGYGDTVTYDGLDTQITYTKDKDSHSNDYIVAIDALSRPKNQYCTELIMRQINKSYIGFNIFEEIKTVCTGNWGCGVFGGDPQLKFIIQWVSATLANKSIIYYPYGDKKMVNIGEIIDILEGKQIGTVFKQILDFQQQYEKTVFEFIREVNGCDLKEK